MDSSFLFYKHTSDRKRQRNFGLGLLLLILAFTCWNLDRSRVWCSPSSILQGHAVWHLLSLSGLCCLWGSPIMREKYESLLQLTERGRHTTLDTSFHSQREFKILSDRNEAHLEFSRKSSAGAGF